MQTLELRQLLEKFLDNSIQPAELIQLRQLTESEENDGILDELIEEVLLQNRFKPEECDRERLLQQVWLHTGMEKPLPVIVPQRVPLLRRSWFRAAASIAVAALIGGALLVGISSRKKEIAAVRQSPSLIRVVPGSNKALLTLADGSTITLDSAGNQVIRQGATAILQKGGRLQYAAGGNSTTIGYNTLTTPRGGQFQVTLPDGTLVWLNAGSYLRYPTAFTGTVRKVELNGEGYFEVAPNVGMPFEVKVGDMQVKVLGTHFNITAYNEENVIRTTLLEGKIRISKGSSARLLQPGQQSSLAVNGSIFTISQPDPDEVLAWKNGLFRFKGDNIVNIMQQLARWYDIEPVYEGNMKMKNFSGTISRKAAITEVLKMLELTEDIHFKIEGRKVIVSSL